jgi:tRNA threonylcarbamoyladenosine biosynthesis protein TsaB
MLLAIDTATQRSSVALHDGSRLRAECTWESPNRHTVTLLPRVVQLLASCELEPRDLMAIGVCIGPGSYTGVRIGVSVAKGFASACKLALVGVSTLDILVASQPWSQGLLYATFSAGRTRVGYARYRCRDDGWHAESGVQVVSWAELADVLAADLSTELPPTVVGEIGSEGREALRPLFGRVAIPAPAWHMRRAGFLADIAWERLRANQRDAPSALLPLYAR